MVAALALVLLAACGGSSPSPTPLPTPLPTVEPVVAPTVTSVPTVEPTNTPLPAPTATPAVDETAAGFADLLACLEDRLGPEVAQTLVAGERQETPVEKLVVESCLLITAAGVSSQDLTPAVTACLEEGLEPGVVEVVGSGARPLTADEEIVLLGMSRNRCLGTD